MSRNSSDPKLLKARTGEGGDTHSPKPNGYSYEFYLSGEILEPENYIDWFDTIRNAGPQDAVVIYINSQGGDLHTAIQFLRVAADSQAHITTSVEGACMSAATMIFLAAHEQEVTPHSLFMFHNYSGGTFGKGGEMIDQLKFEYEWSRKFLTSVYQDFLTEQEIQSMLDNKDLWMTAEEVVQRLSDARKRREAAQQTEQLAESA